MPTIYTDFSARDFTAIYERLLTILHRELPELTDANHADPGIALTRLLARSSDALSLQIDKSFAESFIEPCKFKQSAINTARTVDLSIKGATAASTVVEFTRNDIPSNKEDLLLPRFTRCIRSDGQEYVTLSSVLLPVGPTSGQSIVVEGEYVEYVISFSDLLYNTRSGRYYYNLGANVCFNHVWVIENDVIPWTNVDSFWRSSSTDRHFRLDVYADYFNGVANTVNLTLGNNISGYAPEMGFLRVGFIRCNGPLGNAGTGTITTIEQQYTGKVFINNIIPATGGSYGETLKDFKERIPAVVRTQHRAVSEPDYKGLVRSIPGVKRCQAVDRNNSTLFPWEHTIIYVAPEGGGNMSPELKEQVFTELTSWGHHGSWRKRYILKDAVQHIVNVSCRIGVAYGYNPFSVVSLVNTSIIEFFSIDNVDIYQLLDFGSLHRTVMEVDGVSWVEFNTPTDDIQPDYGHIITLGTLSVIVDN